MILLTVLAHADVGPAPKCPEGTHSQYLYGRHCPRDGFHMEAQPDGGVIEVADNAQAPTPPTPPTPPTEPPVADAPPTTVPEVPPPANPTVAEVPPASTPPEAPPARWCSAATASSGAFLMFAGLFAGWTRRRAPRTDS